MLWTTMLRRKLLLALAAVSVAALLGTPAAYAQGGSPLSSSTGLGISGGVPLTGGSNFTGISNFTGGSNFTGSSSFSGTSSFTGGTSMLGGASFTGGTTFRGGFNGNTLSGSGSFSGTANRQASGGGVYGGTGSASGISLGSAFSAYYVNPLAAGAPAVSSLAQFNSPIFTNGSQAGNLGGYASGNFGSQYAGSPYGANGSPSGTGTGTAANNRRPSFVIAPDSSLMAPAGGSYRSLAPNQLQSDVAQVLARSTSLSPNRDIQVSVEGPVVVLRGTVASPHDRGLAEALIHLTPGVQDVRNELEVPGMVPQPGPGP
jgi:hypothetical protein